MWGFSALTWLCFYPKQHKEGGWSRMHAQSYPGGASPSPRPTLVTGQQHIGLTLGPAGGSSGSHWCSCRTGSVFGASSGPQRWSPCWWDPQSGRTSGPAGVWEETTWSINQTWAQHISTKLALHNVLPLTLTWQEPRINPIPTPVEMHATKTFNISWPKTKTTIQFQTFWHSPGHQFLQQHC